MCDGFLFTGGRPNVHPSNYGVEATAAHGDFDRDRCFNTSLDKKGCFDRSSYLWYMQRISGNCVAMGATLHPEIRELDGRMNHRMPPDGTLEEKFAISMKSRLEAMASSANFSSDRIETNTLHGQGIADAGDRLIIDGWASDGTLRRCM